MLVVCPPEAEWQRLGRTLARSLDVPLAAPDELIDPETQEFRQSARGSHLVLMGTMVSNPLIFRLYGTYHSFEDSLYPGSGGWVIRTAIDPVGLGADALIVGASDAEAMRRAVSRVQELAAGGAAQLRWRLEVSAGAAIRAQISACQDAAARLAAELPAWIERDTPRFTGFPPPASNRPPMPRTGIAVWYEDATKLLGRTGFLYALSADRRFAEAAARIAEALVRHQDELFDQGMRILSFDYVLEMMIRGWDLVEHDPSIPSELREEVGAFLVRAIREGGHLAPSLEELERSPRVFSRHPMSGAFGFWVAGRYLLRHFAPSAAVRALLEERMAIADRMFGWAAETFCDDYNHPWSFDTIQMVSDYALEKPLWKYVKGRNAARAADLAALVTGSLGACCGYGAENQSAVPYYAQCLLLRAEALYRSGRFGGLYRVLGRPPRPITSWLDRSIDGFHAFRTGRDGVAPGDHLGVAIAPVNAVLFEDVRCGRFPLVAGTVDPGIPMDRAFHKMSLRAGFSQEALYLLVEGMSDLTYSSVAPGGIVALQDGGEELLTDLQIHPSAFHRNAAVFATGGPRNRISYLARLDWASDLARIAYVRVSVDRGEQGGLMRVIVWEKGRYLLVLDRFEARSAVLGRLAVCWRSLGPASRGSEQRSWRAVVRQRSLDIITTHREAANVSWATFADSEPLFDTFYQRLGDASVLRAVLTGPLSAGESFAIASLLVPGPKEDRSRFNVRFLSDATIEVDGPLGRASYTIGSETANALAPMEALLQTPHTVAVLGVTCDRILRDIGFEPASGRVEVTDAGWFAGADFRWGPRERWEGTLSAAVSKRLLSAQEAELLVSRAKDGGSRTQGTCSTERTPPTEQRSSGLAVIAADDLQESFGIGAVTVIASGPVGSAGEWLGAAAGGRRIVLFDPTGRMRAETEAPGTIISLWVGQIPGGGPLALLAGTSEGHAAAYDSVGTEVWRYQLPAPFLYTTNSYTIMAAELPGLGPCGVVGTYSGFYALDRSGAWVWGRHAYGGFATNGIAAELVSGEGRRLVGASFMGCATVFDTRGTDDLPVPCWSGRNGRCHTLAVHDCDGDGIGELLVGHDRGLARVCFSTAAVGETGIPGRLTVDWQRTWRHWTEAEVLVLDYAPGGRNTGELVAIDATGFVSRYGTDGRFLGSRPVPSPLTAAAIWPLHTGCEAMYALGTCDAGLLFADSGGRIRGAIGLPKTQDCADPARRLAWLDDGGGLSTRLLVLTMAGRLHLAVVRR